MLKSEIKKITLSLTFALFLFTMVGMYVSQMMPDLKDGIKMPEPGQEYYGSKVVENTDILMPAATESLIEEYLTGYYKAYPFMFYKEVHLNKSDEEKLANVINRLTGLEKEELDRFTDYTPGGYVQSVDENGNGTVNYNEPVLPDYEPDESVSYDEFKQLMEQADDIIGGGSMYASDKLVSNFSRIPMTYEDALAEYEEITNPENIGESYTRLFCDYMGIYEALIAVFVVAFYWSMDRRAKTQELIYSRRISTIKLVLVRNGALMLCMVPAIVLPFIHMIVKVNALYSDMNIRWGGAILQMLMWMLPGLLFVTVLAALITELLSPYIAIFFQGAWWFTALVTNNLVGSISKWTLILRHNTLGDLSVWNNELSIFLWNRAFYLVLSAVITAVLIVVYSLKRRGRMNIDIKLFKRNSCKKSENSI